MENNQILEIKTKFNDKIVNIKHLSEIDSLKVEFLGKKGYVTNLFKEMGKLSPDDRPKFGEQINNLKNEIENKIKELEEKLTNEEINKKLENDYCDVTLPGKFHELGHIHPILQVINEISEIFNRLGFTISEGPEIETSYINFDALNMFEWHPARDMQDSFYVTDNIVLRTHTSGVQIRTMLKYKPPIKIIAPGRVYRLDEVDASHSPVFHQIEGLMVDKNVNFSMFKSIITLFCQEFFGFNKKVVFRPSYFPFTEPSAEVDVECIGCNGKGCNICKNTGFLEIMGAGMVHPDVLKNCNIDPDIYTGFAFGMGIERIAMLKYAICDIRDFYINDLRFLKQF